MSFGTTINVLDIVAGPYAPNIGAFNMGVAQANDTMITRTRQVNTELRLVYYTGNAEISSITMHVNDPMEMD